MIGISFDIESTGISTTKDKIIQLSLVKIDEFFNQLGKRKFTFSNDGVPIQKDAFKAHGISEESLIGAPLFSSLAKSIYDSLESVDFIHGYNIKGFDIPMLYEEFARCGIIWTPKKIVDSCVIFKKFEERNLGAAYKFYCGKQIQGAHDAENDVLASCEVLEGQMFKYGFNSLEEMEQASKYENEEERLTFDGKIIKNKEGLPIWNFGKYKDKNTLVSSDLGYCDWILNGDFPMQTKNLIRSILNCK